jgi:hypothetical protein
VFTSNQKLFTKARVGLSFLFTVTIGEILLTYLQKTLEHTGNLLSSHLPNMAQKIHSPVLLKNGSRFFPPMPFA